MGRFLSECIDRSFRSGMRGVVMLVLLVRFTRADGQNTVQKECMGITCKNDGTLVMKDDACACACAPDYSGVFCEYALTASLWPPGSYALPMAKDGCPEPESAGWHYGYMNFSAQVPAAILWTRYNQSANSTGEALTDLVDLRLSTSPALLGPYNSFTFQLNFCYKTALNDTDDTGTWPEGAYSIYGTDTGCPSDFDTFSHTLLVLPSVVSWNRDGHTPPINMLDNNDGSVTLQALMCRRKNTPAKDSTSLGNVPFLLLKLTGSDCPTLDGYDVEEETLAVVLATEVVNTSVPETADGISYCYCKPIDWTYGSIERKSFSGSDFPHLTTSQKLLTGSVIYPDEFHGMQGSSIDTFNTTFATTFVDYTYAAAVSYASHDFLPWILFDFGRVLNVKLVDVYLSNRARDHIQLEREFPAVAVSNHKWAFLHHGAVSYVIDHYQDTRNYNIKDRHAHTFRGHAAGKYLSVYGKNYQSKEKMAEYFVHIAAVSIRVYSDSGKQAKSCLQRMGMEDGGIRDYQLSASSWQPGYPPDGATPMSKGWCAMMDDPTPFLQVDLLSPTLVEGFTLINWLETGYVTFMGVEVPIPLEKGSNAVRLHYSTSGTHFRAYQEQLFEKDRSAVFSEPQTFLLVRPVLARYIRIEAMSVGNSSCLKLELLGCRKHGLHSVQCANDDTRTMFKANYALKSIPFPVASPNVTSHEECMDTCHNDVTGCMTVMYKEDGVCDIYATDPRHQYHVVQASEGMTQTMFVCWKDAFEIGPLVGDDIHFLDSTTPTVGAGILTTTGYPVPYAAGQDWLWKITVDNGKYARLLFSNISLNTYGNLSHGGCGDTLDVLISFDPRRGHLMTLDHTYTGYHPSPGTDKSVLYLRLRSCTTFLQNSVQGVGFRAIVLAEDLPLCYTSRHRSLCMMASMMLISDSFLGIPPPDKPYYETWRMGTRAYAGVILTILDFDVRCDTGTRFQIHMNRRHDFKNSLVYCNANLTSRRIESRYGLMEIHFTRANYDPNKALEGFKAKYETAVRDKVLLDMVTSVTENTERRNGLPVYHKVCVDRFKKCYHVLKIASTPREAWSVCEKMNLRRVSLRHRLEGHVIGAVITNLTGVLGYAMRAGYTGSYNYNPYMFVHMGLKLYHDDKGNLQQYWEDGSPASYFDWDEDQPADVRKLRCAGMKIYVFPQQKNWETIHCNTLHVFRNPPNNRYDFHFVVCEENTDPTHGSVVNPNFDANAGRLLSSRAVATGQPSEKGILYKCVSGEWVIRLSLCDGFPDCLDGSDEQNCTDTTDCAPDQFQCSNAACIHLSQICDFREDCEEGEDEYCVYPSCASDEFECTSKQCIKDSQRCDATKHCYDGSDEISCPQCDTTRSFMCSDFTCISKKRRCDGYKDCPNGLDENNCSLDPKSVETCADVWEKGMRQSDTYSIYYSDAKALRDVWCGFDDVFSDNSMTWVINETDVYNNELRYSMVDERWYVGGGYQCEQTITQTCLATEMELAMHDGIHFQISHSDCTCVQLQFKFTTGPLVLNSAISMCGDPGNPNALAEDASTFAYGPHVTFTNGYRMDAIPNRFRFIPGKVECHRTGYIPPADFACENSTGVFPNSQLCLYDEDEFGVVEACRDKIHLRDCETFQCPTGYVKCPNSFCILTQFVCDGRIHCPDGDDELGCHCKDNKQTVMFFHHISMDEKTRGNIHGMARQFYTSSRTVSVIEYEFLSGLAGSSLITVLTNQLDRVEIRLTEHVIGLSNENLNAWQARTFVTYFDTLMHALVDNTTVMNDTVYAFISISNSPISETFGKIMFSEDAVPMSVTARYYYRFSFDPTIRGNSERRMAGMVTEVKLRNLEYLTLGSVLLPEICNVTDDVSCPNEYKCTASRACIPLTQVCDGVTQCSHGDDEKLCNFQCPSICSCNGYTVNCGQSDFINSDFSQLYKQTRTLDLSFNKNASSDGLIRIPVRLPFLYKLNISHCDMTTVNPDSFSNTTNLQDLDIGYNMIEIIPLSTFQFLQFLKRLNLKGNFVLKTLEPGAFLGLSSVSELTISGTQLSRIVPNTFLGLTLTLLDLSSNKINAVDDFAFKDITIEAINLENNDIDVFSDNMFAGVKAMKVLNAPEYKFCCIRPGDVLEEDCHPYKDEFSSCSDLMRNSALQALLWIVGLTAFCGNAGSLFYRLTFDRKRMKLGYGIFVTNLAVADFMMSVFMIIIAIADVVFRDRYIWNDESWRNSGWCTLAGLLSTVSSEASVFFICLITIDRVLVIKYPFGDVRFSPNTAWIASMVTWFSAFIIGLLPIFYVDYFDNRFYTKSGVCIALPLTRDRPPGWMYSIMIFIVFNFLTFLLIAFGQVMLFLEIKKAPAMGSSKRQNNRDRDLKIARNLLLVVMTDFLCWFPIGIMGIMAASGTPISGTVYAWAAVLILPINSALNPFLYTASAIASKKKFAPDLDEQSRPNENLEAARQCVQLWEFKGFVRDNDYVERNRTLEEIVQLQTISPKCAAWLVLNLVSRMNFLHKQELVFGKLQMDKILIITEQGKNLKILEDMQIRLKPVVSTDKNSKPNDVYELGGIVRNIIRATRPARAGKGTNI